MRCSGPRMVLYRTLAAVKHLLGENIYMKIEFAMNKNIIFFALLTMLSACTGKDNGKRQANVGNNQNVMILNIGNFKWTRQPESCVIKGDTIEVVTKPGTDLWQRTYYLFRNDNAPVFQMETEEKFFSFVVKTDFTESHHRFDQCGIVMYLDSENWLKGSVEYENEEFQHLGSVVTNNGYSDWATTAIPANVKTCGTDSLVGRLTIALSARRMAKTSHRCAYVTCIKAAERYGSESTPARLRSHPSRLSSPT